MLTRARLSWPGLAREGACEGNYLKTAYPRSSPWKRDPVLHNLDRTGFPKFTNEVQHLLRRVLRWDASTDSCHWRAGARLPDFKPKGDRSGKSRRLWIARHRAFLVK